MSWWVIGTMHLGCFRHWDKPDHPAFRWHENGRVTVSKPTNER